MLFHLQIENNKLVKAIGAIYDWIIYQYSFARLIRMLQWLDGATWPAKYVIFEFDKLKNLKNSGPTILVCLLDLN